MEPRISYETSLFGDEVAGLKDIYDGEFWACRMVDAIRFRPHSIDEYVTISVTYCKNEVFRRKILEKANKCIVLIYRLFKRGVFIFEEIEPLFTNYNSYVICYYFRKDIKDFAAFIRKKTIPVNIDKSFLENEFEFDDLIEYGYLPLSIEYCLKYDDIVVFRTLDMINTRKAKWSPFEWSLKPKSLDLLSFSGFYGSIKCFKHLLMNGHQISHEVASSVICSGSFELFHCCNEVYSFSHDYIIYASMFFRLKLLQYFIDNGVDVDSRETNDLTSLHYASQFGHLSIAEYLVDHGADINAKDNNEKTPLHYSAGKGHLCMVEYLISHGADVNSVDNCFLFSIFLGLLFITQLKKDILVA